MKKMLAVAIGLFAVSTMLAGGNALADKKADKMVKQRQAVMVLLSKYFGPIGKMASGKMVYKADVVARNTAYVDALSQMAWDGFKPSTKGSKSRTKPAAYSQPDKFLAEQEKFQDNVMKLRTLVDRGDQGFLSQIKKVGKDCKSCHKKFRAKKKKK